MTRIDRILLIFTLLLAFQTTKAQEDIKNNIIAEAERVSKALLEGDYDLILEYTHPNVIAFSGGKEKMANYLEQEMTKMAEDGYSFESIVVGEPMAIKMYKGAYQALIPKTTTMRANGQQIIIKDHLFGFSDEEGKKWTFVEADKMQSEAAKQLFPDFETEIDIPKKEAPVIVNEDGTEEIMEPADENAGTYDTPFETGKQIGFVLGILFVILFSIIILVGIAFLIVYFRKKKKKKTATPKVDPTPAFRKSEKINCGNCDSKNNPDSKYCAFCGHTL